MLTFSSKAHSLAFSAVSVGSTSPRKRSSSGLTHHRLHQYSPIAILSICQCCSAWLLAVKFDWQTSVVPDLWATRKILGKAASIVAILLKPNLNLSKLLWHLLMVVDKHGCSWLVVSLPRRWYGVRFAEILLLSIHGVRQTNKQTTGFPFSFGVFQEYYQTHEPFSNDKSGISTIGTTAMVG